MNGEEALIKSIKLYNDDEKSMELILQYRKMIECSRLIAERGNFQEIVPEEG